MSNRSNFPEEIDQFIEHYEIGASDVSNVARFQELLLKANRTQSEDDEMANLKNSLRDKLMLAEDFNKFQDSLTNMQVFIRDEVDGYIQQKQSEMESYVDGKKSEVETFVTTKKSDMEDHHQEKIDELDSLVQRTEADVIIRESEPTSGLYDGLMWFQPSTTDTKVYLSGEFREVGGGGGSLQRYVNSVELETDSDRVNIGIEDFDKARDILLVYQNSTYKKEGREYRINVDSSEIVSLEGNWSQETVFDFVVLTSIPSRDTLNNAKFENVYTIQVDGETNIKIGIPEFNSNTDIIDVFDEGIKLIEEVHYELNDDGVSIDLKYSPTMGNHISFTVFKKVRLNLDSMSTDGSLLMSDSITNDKLHQDIKVGSLTNLDTEAKSDVVSAVNEVRQENKTHKEDITSQEGKHGIRFLNNKLEVKVDGVWESLTEEETDSKSIVNAIIFG